MSEIDLFRGVLNLKNMYNHSFVFNMSIITSFDMFPPTTFIYAGYSRSSSPFTPDRAAQLLRSSLIYTRSYAKYSKLIQIFLSSSIPNQLRVNIHFNTAGTLASSESPTVSECDIEFCNICNYLLYCYEFLMNTLLKTLI